jgi:hypothetical protein
VVNRIFAATAIMHLVELRADAPGSCGLASLHGATLPVWHDIGALADDVLHIPEDTQHDEIVDLHDDSSDDEHRVLMVDGNGPARRPVSRMRPDALTRAVGRPRA